MKLNTVPGQPGHLAEVLAVCFPSTPPAVNDEAPGASGADSGQGVCTHQRFRLSITWPVDAIDRPESLSANTFRECADWVEVVMAAGATTCTVEALS